MPKTRLTAKLCSTSPSESEKALNISATDPVPVSVRNGAEDSKCYNTCLECNKNWSFADCSLHEDDCDSQYSYNSDDDLPDAFLTSSKGFEIPKKGDALWVKPKNELYFWPCLVLETSLKIKKLRVVYLSANCNPNNGYRQETEYMKYDKRRIYAFNHKLRTQFEAEGKSLQPAEKQKEFQNAMSRIVDYLTKRALGHLTACKVFLNEFLIEDDAPENGMAATAPQTADSTASLQPSLPSAASLAATVSPGKRKKMRDEANESPGMKQTRKRPMSPASRKRLRKIKNEGLVQYICSAPMKDYLLGIYRGEIKCVRHSLYMKGRAVKLSNHGPIDDDEQLDQITSTLVQWHKDLTPERLPDLNYVFNVWSPEAIIHGITKVNKRSRQKAEEIFYKGIKLTNSEHKEIHKQLINF